MRVHWTKNAIEHLAGIFEYIEINSPTYARRVVDRITRRSEQIAEQPLSGRKVPEYAAEDIREVIEAIPDNLQDKAKSNRCYCRDSRGKVITG